MIVHEKDLHHVKTSKSPLTMQGMCSQYVLRVADQDGTVGAAKRTATRRSNQFV